MVCVTPTRGDPPALAGDNDDQRSPTPMPASGRVPHGQRPLVILETFVSICGLAGGLYMATHERSVMPVRYLQGTWFSTWRWPGLALVLFVGVCPALVVAATLLRRPEAAVGHVCIGVGLIAWIALEAAWVVVSPGMQIFIGSLGIAILVCRPRYLHTRWQRSMITGRHGFVTMAAL